MKSIRRMLILNLFLLLVLTLGAVCGLVYSTTSQSLRAREAARSELLQRQFEDSCDEALLTQARVVADLTQSRFVAERLRQMELLSLGMMLAQTDPRLRIQSPLWLRQMEDPRAPPAFLLQIAFATEIRLNEDLLHREPDAENHEFIQINSELGNVWKSRSVGDLSLDFDVAKLKTGPRFSWLHDNVELGHGMMARRVVLKVPVTRFEMSAPPPPPPRSGMGPLGPPGSFELVRGLLAGSVMVHPDLRRYRFPEDRSRGRSMAFTSRIPPTFYIQCAWDKESGHPTLQALAEKRDQQVQQLITESANSLKELRFRLAWIGLTTLAAVLVGGWLVVGFALKPLGRLSHAVSRVSIKDFQIPLDRADLPSEVQPVVDRLQRSLNQLQRAFEREKQAAADISHELRTPLTALLVSIDVALRKPRTAEQYQETLHDLRIIARQMSDMVERLLLLARIDAETDLFSPRPTRIRNLIESCAAIGRPLAEAQGLQFRVNLEETPDVRTDPDKLREVLINLLHNAIEYNRPGGMVELSARSGVGGGVILEVRDTGIGIAEDQREKIFERFYRADPSRQCTGIHAGLGLAIVREYVRRLGGSLNLESHLGTGSRFRVEVPNV